MSGELPRIEARAFGIVRRAEPMGGPLRMIPANARAIRSALEAAGVEFIAENGGGPGVRLRKSLQ